MKAVQKQKPPTRVAWTIIGMEVYLYRWTDKHSAKVLWQITKHVADPGHPMDEVRGECVSQYVGGGCDG